MVAGGGQPSPADLMVLVADLRRVVESFSGPATAIDAKSEEL